MIQISETTGPGTGEAYCVITNTNLKFDENVSGPVKTKILDLKGTYADLWIIDQLESSSPRAKKYSISLRIAFQRQTTSPVLPTPIELGRFTDGKLFIDSGKLSVKTEKIAANFTSGQIISITPRTRIYRLNGVIPPPPVNPLASQSPPGWDIEDLRDQVNANDPWIEMLERSGPTSDGLGGPPVPNLNPSDVQDAGIDTSTLSQFSAKYLTGGDGLPASPNNETTGPSRSIVHVNYGEKLNGELGETNTVYEWAGDNTITGTWKVY